MAENDRPASKVGRDEAVERLARELFECLEHLDPSTDEKWCDLNNRERDLYRTAIGRMAAHRDLWRLLISPAPDNNVILGRSKIGKKADPHTK